MNIGRLSRRGTLVLIGGAIAIAAGAGTAYAFWTASDNTHAAAAAADFIQRSSTPTANTIDATSVSLSWAPTSTTGGHAATGYTIARYDASSGGTMTSAGGTCAGTVTSTSCTDTGVPGGSWYYTVTPHIALWSGPESVRSSAARTATKLVITSAPASRIASNSANLGPVTVSLQDSVGNPLTAPTGGTTVSLSFNSTGTASFALTQNGSTVSVTIPAGSANANFYYGLRSNSTTGTQADHLRR